MVALSKNLLAMAALAMSLQSVDAFWRLPCRGVLSTERADPIDAPDKVASHVHQVHGGNSEFSPEFLYAGGIRIAW